MTLPCSSSITRRRMVSTIRSSWVAMTTVVPVRLMRSSSFMMSWEVVGSRFPVGSSQSISRGRLTNARADGLIGEELEVLEHAADGTPPRRHLPGGEPVQLLARHPDVPGAGPLLLDQQADEGRLAGAGLADDEDELALADLHRDVVEGDDVVTVDLGDVVECDHGCEQPFALRGSAWLGGLEPAWAIGRWETLSC